MKTRTTVSAVVAALGLSAAASADTISAKFDGRGRGTDVKAILDANAQNVFAGSLRFTLTNGAGLGAPLNGAHHTFCADLLQTVSGTASTHQVVAPSAVTNAISGVHGAARAAALNDLYANFGLQAINPSANNDFATAFQLMVWDILYDYTNAGISSLSLTSGRFAAQRTNGSALSASIVGHFDTLRGAIGTEFPGTGLFAITSAARQDQLVYVQQLIPTPGAAALAGVGLLALARRRR